MTKVYLVRTGQTAWESQGRVDSTIGTPLTAQGASDVQTVIAELADQKVTVLYSPDGQAERQTAAMISAARGVKVRIDDDLRELDFGLWQGLTLAEIQRRQPRMYRQWLWCPQTVRPPQGETVDEATERLRNALARILKRHQGAGPLLVLRPVAMGLMRCILQGEPISALRGNMEGAPAWSSHRPAEALQKEKL
jgi:broad specificity phosphatase PhoE